MKLTHHNQPKNHQKYYVRKIKEVSLDIISFFLIISLKELTSVNALIRASLSFTFPSTIRD